ncbi:MAG: preprotein translocase subunit SecA [Kiritimatiellia bacterium]
MQWLIKKIIGTKNDRDLRQIRPLVNRINVLEQEYQTLTDDQLKAKTPEFRERLAKGESLDDILCEAFAVAKNACRRLVGTTYSVCGHERTWMEIPYDVQLIGGIGLHQHKIAEMATGEGKTLVATLPVYLNALTGRGVHVVTVNDYLALRDAEWMGLVYQYLGLTVGVIQNQMPPPVRRQMYACDITYGTNSEFGFDYLRDNMTYVPEDRVQRGHFYAIVDEIDSILIDEARTPLIISGPSQNSAVEEYIQQKPQVERLYRRQKDLIATLLKDAKKLLEAGELEAAGDKLYQVQQGMPKSAEYMRMVEDIEARRALEKASNRYLTDMNKERGRELREELYFTIDEKGTDAGLTEKGSAAMAPNNPDQYLLPDLATLLSEVDGNEALSPEEKFRRRQEIHGGYNTKSRTIHAVDQLIRAYSIYERDVQYVVQENQVVIVDENTGRLMTGRRWSDGLHQAVEAKEGVTVERETQTYATITIQNYFRMYEKLAGMTGTAETEADEFATIYKLDVLVIPTNRPVRRLDLNDLIFKTQREKFAAVVEEIVECHQRRQPVLVGTVSVESSEKLSRLLEQRGIQHNVLNAKNHAREAEIVSRAGLAGAVTIATNMAGRGTDIKLGEGVIYIDREFLKGQGSLDDRVPTGEVLRKLLNEKPCGLHVIGTERHDSRRIDRQLRGRCARQGDPGSSRFYVSLEDDLMRRFGSDRVSGMLERLGLKEGEAMESGLLNRSLQNAQRKVEQYYFSIRKRTLEYDDVMNRQREVVYGLRTEALTAADPRPALYETIQQIVDKRADEMVASTDAEGLAEYVNWVNATFMFGFSPSDFAGKAPDAAGIAALVMGEVRTRYDERMARIPAEFAPRVDRHVLLTSIDNHWQEYLRGIDGLRQGIGLVGYGQRDPVVEFKREAHHMFLSLMDEIATEIGTRMFRTQINIRVDPPPQPRTVAQHPAATGPGGEPSPTPGEAVERTAPPPRAAAGSRMVDSALNQLRQPPPAAKPDLPKVGRNDPCPCGSGKKYKKCHGLDA